MTATGSTTAADGIGGRAVVRAQADPRTTGLAHVHIGTAAPRVLLLHGLGGTSAVWSGVLDELGRAQVPRSRWTCWATGPG